MASSGGPTHQAAPAGPALPKRAEPSTANKLVAASAAASLAAVVVNPFDVVKVRMQAQAASGPAAASVCLNSIPIRSVRSLHQSANLQASASLSGSSSSSSSSSHQLQHTSESMHTTPRSLKEAASNRWRGSSPFTASRIIWHLATGRHHIEAASNYRPCLCGSSGAGALQLSNVSQWEGAAAELGGAFRECLGQQPRANGMTATVSDIIQKEGMAGLWRGLDSALFMCMSNVVLYYPLYDVLMSQMSPKPPPSSSSSSSSSPLLGAATPAAAGALARTLTVLCSSPLEYVRTQQAAAATSGTGSTWQVIRSSLEQAGKAAAVGSPSTAALSHGEHMARLAPAAGAGTASSSAWVRALPTLWTGLGATLARDATFAALYWGMVEAIRGSLLPPDQAPHDRTQLLAANLTAGAVAGGAAGIATTPFDVAKTRMQVGNASQGKGASYQGLRSSMLQELQTVLNEQGLRGLFVGGWARTLRCAGACSVVIASYEGLKSVLSA